MDKTIDMKSVAEFAMNNYRTSKCNVKPIDDTFEQINKYNKTFGLFDFYYENLNSLIQINFEDLVFIKKYLSDNKKYQILYCFFLLSDNTFIRLSDIEQNEIINDKLIDYQNNNIDTIQQIITELNINTIIIHSNNDVEIYEILESKQYMLLLYINQTIYLIENTYTKYYLNKSKIVIDLLQYNKIIDTAKPSNSTIEYFDLCTNEEIIIKPTKKKEKILSPIMNDTVILDSDNAKALISCANKNMKLEELQEIADKLKINTVIGLYKNGKPKYVKKEDLYCNIKACKIE